MYPRLIPFAAALALAGAATAQRTTAGEAAKAFTLDSVAPGPTDTASPPPAADATPVPMPSVSAPTLPPPTLPDSTAVSAAPAPAPAPAETPAPAIHAAFTLDTPIQDLIADPGAKAVLDKDLPGVSDDENIDKFKALSLRAFQPMTGGQMTDAMLAKVASDFDVLAGGTGAVTAPVKVGNAKRRKDDSR